MFTRQELNVLQQALRQYRGPYGKPEQNLTDEEIRHQTNCLKAADALAERFEGILNDYYDMEHKYLFHEITDHCRK